MRIFWSEARHNDERQAVKRRTGEVNKQFKQTLCNVSRLMLEERDCFCLNKPGGDSEQKQKENKKCLEKLIL